MNAEKRLIKSVDRPWGSYTREQADYYYDKLGLMCVSRAEFAEWFMRAERANSPCRRLEHFCNDCLLYFKLENKAKGTCRLALRNETTIDE